MKLSITLWTPRDHRQTEALPQFADYLFLNSLGGRKRAEPRPAEDTALTFSTLCVKQVKNNPVKLSPILLTKLLPLQFLFPYRSSLLQLQAIPANSQPQLGKIMKTLINAEDSLSLWPVYTVTLWLITDCKIMHICYAMFGPSLLLLTSNFQSFNNVPLPDDFLCLFISSWCNMFILMIQREQEVGGSSCEKTSH